jgi:ABC-type spermidine/putrescine transport system permease subunit II
MVVPLLLGRRALGGVDSIGGFSRRDVRRRSPGLLTYALLFMAGLYLPIGILILFAVNTSDQVGFPVTGVTFRWFRAALTDGPLLDSLATSAKVVAWALPLSLALGTLAAVPLARTTGRWRSFSIGVLLLPFSLPPLMAGLGILVTLHAIGVQRGLWTIIAAHSLLILPVVTFIVLVRLEGLDTNIELAAADLGAQPWRVVSHVIVPQVLPAIAAASLIGFAISMDEVVLTFIVTGTDVTLPLFIYGSLRYGVTPELDALSTMMLLATFALFGLGGLVLRWRPRGTWRRHLKL